MTEDECALILSTMLDLEKLPIEESEYNPAYEDLFFLLKRNWKIGSVPIWPGKFTQPVAATTSAWVSFEWCCVNS